MHASGVVAAALDEYFPAAHEMHVSAAASENEPAGHVSANTLSGEYATDITDSNPSAGSDRAAPISRRFTLLDTPVKLNVARVNCWAYAVLQVECSNTKSVVSRRTVRFDSFMAALVTPL